MLNIDNIYEYYLEHKEEYEPLVFTYTIDSFEDAYLLILDKNKNSIARIKNENINTYINLCNGAIANSYFDTQKEIFASVEEQMIFVIDKVTELLEYTQCKCDEALDSIYAYFLNDK